MTQPFHPKADMADASYSSVSFWLETCGDDLTPRPALSSNLQADVAIVGGGFSALWTAYYLLKMEPALDIVIIEKDVVGFGASGRNGGWCSPRFPVETHALKRLFGVSVARSTIKALLDTVDEIGRVCEEEGIDAEYRKNGLLSIAQNAAHMAALSSACKTNLSLGLDDGSRLMDAAETHDYVHASNIVGGMLSSVGAAVHPGKLVRGLARTVEKMGARIFESTTVDEVREGGGAALICGDHVVSARKSVVVANEAYRSTLRSFRRDLVPMCSMIVLTEPLTDDQWTLVGWHGGENLSSPAHTKNYLTRTMDGRILYGSRGAPYIYGSAVPDAGTRDDEMFEIMRKAVRAWWPALEGVRFTHAWGGYLGVPRDWMPTVNYHRERRLATLGGYTGRGVSTSALCGKTLAGLITGQSTGFEALPIHRPSTPRWEPEPFRWTGVRYVQNAFDRLDRAEAADKRGPIDTRLAKWLGEQ